MIPYCRWWMKDPRVEEVCVSSARTMALGGECFHYVWTLVGRLGSNMNSFIYTSICTMGVLTLI
jgi:hypothetical protein